jgi:hypothetical protein
MSNEQQQLVKPTTQAEKKRNLLKTSNLQYFLDQLVQEILPVRDTSMVLTSTREGWNRMAQELRAGRVPSNLPKDAFDQKDVGRPGLSGYRLFVRQKMNEAKKKGTKISLSEISDMWKYG